MRQFSPPYMPPSGGGRPTNPYARQTFNPGGQPLPQQASPMARQQMMAQQLRGMPGSGPAPSPMPTPAPAAPMPTGPIPNLQQPMPVPTDPTAGPFANRPQTMLSAAAPMPTRVPVTSTPTGSPYARR